MDTGKLSRTRLRAWVTLTVWAVTGVVFTCTFFAGGGAGSFAADGTRHLLGAVALLVGFVGSWTVLWVTRQRQGAPAAFDERDVSTVARANQATLVVVLVAVFAFSIGLWAAYETAGSVPVGWLWFLAYGAVILASVASPAAVLLLDGRGGQRG